MAEEPEHNVAALADDDDSDEEDDEEDEDPLAHLPQYVLDRVTKLQDLATLQSQIMDDYLEERAKLEKKYEGLLQPLYQDRAAIICGEKDEEIARDESASAPEKKAGDDNDDEEEQRVKGVPQFWACAMSHVDTIGELITEDDVDCLEHLTDISCVDRDDGKGFTLYFHFNENEYFTNRVLTKSYDVPNLLLSADPVLKNVRGCTIDWKPDRCLTKRTVRKKQRGKGKNVGQVRTVSKEEDSESFFHWFTPPELPAMDTLDEDEAEMLEERFDEDYEVALEFRCKLIPRAVQWFTGEASEEEMEGILREALQEQNE